MRWTWCRAALHRGWWLVTSVYLVVDGRLSAPQLVLVGVAQGLVGLVFEVPAGVVADTLSRKWSLVVSQLLMGVAMTATGLVTGFGPLIATQLVWGLAWTFASGADVAWVTDEIASPPLASAVLMRAGRAQLTGAVAGMVGLGAMGWGIGRGSTMVLAGVAMALLGLYVVARFPERRFVPVPARRWAASWSILARGLSLVRSRRILLVLFAATFLANGVTGAVGRVYPLRLEQVGLRVDPVAWFTVLGVLSYVAGAVALSYVRGVRRPFLVSCLLGAVGVVALSLAPEPFSASAAILLAASALPLTRTFGTIWVNRLVVGGVRATVHSLLAQAEYLGAIACGLTFAAVAGVGGLPLALVSAAALLALAVGLVWSLGARRFSRRGPVAAGSGAAGGNRRRSGRRAPGRS